MPRCPGLELATLPQLLMVVGLLLPNGCFRMARSFIRLPNHPALPCRDFRPSWELNVTEAAAGNYYPLTAAMYIQDSKRQLAVLAERAQGGCLLQLRVKYWLLGGSGWGPVRRVSMRAGWATP